MRISVMVCLAPRRVQMLEIELPHGATVATALRAAGLAVVPDGAGNDSSIDCGVWGRKARLNQPLRDLDRVEVYRPLTVDPKEARRQRYKQHRAAARPQPAPK